MRSRVIARHLLFPAALLAVPIVAASAADAAQKKTSCGTVAAASWLLGDWQAERNGNVVSESWRKAATEDAYVGTGSTVSKDGAVVDSESLRWS